MHGNSRSHPYDARQGTLLTPGQSSELRKEKLSRCLHILPKRTGAGRQLLQLLYDGTRRNLEWRFRLLSLSSHAYVRQIRPPRRPGRSAPGPSAPAGKWELVLVVSLSSATGQSCTDNGAGDGDLSDRPNHACVAAPLFLDATRPGNKGYGVRASESWKHDRYASVALSDDADFNVSVYAR
jgi:hypothetical protein